MSKIRQSARNEDCQVRYPGICNFDKSTTVWAHGNGSAAGKGMWMKSPDYIGAYACFNCHRLYDRQMPAPEGWTRDYIERCFAEGVWRSQRILEEKGLLKAA